MSRTTKIQLSKKLILLYSLLITFTALVVNQLIPWIKFDLNANATHIVLPQAPAFDLNLSDNGALRKAKFLLKQSLRGPDSLVLNNNKIYTGLLNGSLMEIDIESFELKMITQIGNQCDESCNDYGSFYDAKQECGRPLGLRFKEPNWIYLVDSFNGLFKVNIENGQKIHILNSNDPQFGKHKPKYLNDLDVDNEGNIYFTDSSYRRNVNEAVELFVEGNLDGRIFVYNEVSNNLNLLLDNIHFANGVQLTPNSTALLISETHMARILKYHLKGSKKGEVEVFLNLPGFPDNIRLTPHDTLLVSFAAVRQPHRSIRSLMDFLGEYPMIRAILASIFNLRAIRSQFVPKYGLVAEYDLNGTLIQSWHDSSGEFIQATSSAIISDNKLYLGSFIQDFIAIVDI